jgi:hypothetical protein
LSNNQLLFNNQLFNNQLLYNNKLPQPLNMLELHKFSMLKKNLLEVKAELNMFLMKNQSLNMKLLLESNTFLKKKKSLTTMPLNIKLNIFLKFIRTNILNMLLKKKLLKELNTKLLKNPLFTNLNKKSFKSQSKLSNMSNNQYKLSNMLPNQFKLSKSAKSWLNQLPHKLLPNQLSMLNLPLLFMPNQLLLMFNQLIMLLWLIHMSNLPLIISLLKLTLILTTTTITTMLENNVEIK